MKLVDTAAVTLLKLDSERNKLRMDRWGTHVIYGVWLSALVTILYYSSPTFISLDRAGVLPVLVLAYIYLGVATLLTLNCVIDHWIYRYAMKLAEQPYQHSLFIPMDVVETKARGEDKVQIKTWEEKVLMWSEENVGKSACRKTAMGYRFYFKEFEDYALFKLWV